MNTGWLSIRNTNASLSSCFGPIRPYPQQSQSRMSVEMAMLLRWNALADFQGPGSIRHQRNLNTNILDLSTLAVHLTSFWFD